MFSRILLKLVDQAIIPAFLVVATRILSVILISHYFNIELLIDKTGITFTNPNEYLFVNSYSLLCIIAVIALSLSVTIAMSIKFHHEHIKPSTTAKLFSLKMSSLINNSFEIYTKASILISYLWLLTFTSGIMLYSQLIYNFVFDISVIVTAVFTILLISDVEKKTKVSKNNDFIFDMDRKFLEKDK